MSEYLPTRDFEWVEPTIDGLKTFIETSDIDQIYKVDRIYPHLYNLHNDLSFLPKNNIPAGSKV